MNLTEEEIVRRYVQELRGVSNYYSRAKNWKHVGNHLHWLCKDSLAKTLASKNRTKRTRTYGRMRVGRGFGIQTGDKTVALLPPKEWRRYTAKDPDRKPKGSVPTFQNKG